MIAVLVVLLVLLIVATTLIIVLYCMKTSKNQFGMVRAGTTASCVWGYGRSLPEIFLITTDPNYKYIYSFYDTFDFQDYSKWNFETRADACYTNTCASYSEAPGIYTFNSNTGVTITTQNNPSIGCQPFRSGTTTAGCFQSGRMTSTYQTGNPATQGIPAGFHECRIKGSAWEPGCALYPWFACWMTPACYPAVPSSGQDVSCWPPAGLDESICWPFNFEYDLIEVTAFKNASGDNTMYWNMGVDCGPAGGNATYNGQQVAFDTSTYHTMVMQNDDYTHGNTYFWVDCTFCPITATVYSSTGQANPTPFYVSNSNLTSCVTSNYGSKNGIGTQWVLNLTAWPQGTWGTSTCTESYPSQDMQLTASYVVSYVANPNYSPATLRSSRTALSCTESPSDPSQSGSWVSCCSGGFVYFGNWNNDKATWGFLCLDTLPQAYISLPSWAPYSIQFYDLFTSINSAAWYNESIADTMYTDSCVSYSPSQVVPDTVNGGITITTSKAKSASDCNTAISPASYSPTNPCVSSASTLWHLPDGCENISSTWTTPNCIKSGRLTSINTVTLGFHETKFKQSAQNGSMQPWSAVWLRGISNTQEWPITGEFDLAELISPTSLNQAFDCNKVAGNGNSPTFNSISTSITADTWHTALMQNNVTDSTGALTYETRFWIDCTFSPYDGNVYDGSGNKVTTTPRSSTAPTGYQSVPYSRWSGTCDTSSYTAPQHWVINLAFWAAAGVHGYGAPACLSDYTTDATFQVSYVVSYEKNAASARRFNS